MLNLTVIMKMQIKTTWFRFPPIRLFKKKTAISGYGKDGGYAGEMGGIYHTDDYVPILFKVVNEY